MQDSSNLALSFFDARDNKFDLEIGFDELLVPGNYVIGDTGSNSG